MAIATAPHPVPAHQLAPANPEEELQTTTIKDNTSPSTSEIKVPRGPVDAKLFFFDPPKDGSAPYNYVEAPPAGQPQRNFSPREQTVTINDIRGVEHQFTLDNDAFEAISSETVSKTTSTIGSNNNEDTDPIDFTSETDVKERYYLEVEKLLLDNLPGAHKIYLFDHTIRRANKNAPREPVLRVHIDQTPKSALQRIHHHLPNEASTLSKGRYRIINVWRPLNPSPIVSLPLAFASGKTTSDKDLIPVEHRYPDRTGETAAVKYDKDQKWYYWSGMEGSERLLLKCFDSDESVGGWGRVPHTAFVDPRTEERWPGRESIEVRALVFG